MQGNLVVGQLREGRVCSRRQPEARRGVYSIESASLYRIQMFRLVLSAPWNRDCRRVILSSSVPRNGCRNVLYPSKKQVWTGNTARNTSSTEYLQRHHCHPSKVFRNDAPSSLCPKAAIVASGEAVLSIEGLRLEQETIPGVGAWQPPIDRSIVLLRVYSRNNDVY